MTTTATPQTTADKLDSVLAAGPRPSRPGGVTTSLAFGWRAILRIKHVPEQLFDVTLFPVMSVLLFTYLFGGAIAGSTDAYLQYVLPGILVQTIVMITMYTGVALNTDIEKGVYDRIRTLPVWRPSALVGALLGDAVRYTLASVFVVVLGLVLGYRPDGGLPGVVAGVALLMVFCFGFSWIWTFLGLLARSPQSVMGISMMILFPAAFLSPVFVDPETMPGWLQVFVEINPISHVVYAVRGLMAGDAVGDEVMWTLVAAAVITAIFAPLTMSRFGKRR
ncbi:ABC-2 type transport system permease protein [Mumia flava]|uniref:Transport permease protein n=1 Tax=Mumia flava TaxID=1348852 RepID=A0A0B2B8N1_9ACTN|nr:ABC transporter permease [Mumia flava]PJJ53494.1 ABC-2 type transport system permease protein [Mumia flava]